MAVKLKGKIVTGIERQGGEDDSRGTDAPELRQDLHRA
jgi:hypothetical protein